MFLSRFPRSMPSASEHLIHDQPHNRFVTGVPMMTDWLERRGHVFPLVGAVSVWDAQGAASLRWYGPLSVSKAFGAPPNLRMQR